MKEKYAAVFKKMTNTKSLVIILLLGIGLLLLPGQGQKSEKKNDEKSTLFEQVSTADYEKNLEKRLADILESLDGIKKAQVMITLEDSGEVYYAQDRSANEKGDSITGQAEHSIQSDEAFVLKIDSGGGQSPVILKTKAPRISGVFAEIRFPEKEFSKVPFFVHKSVVKWG